ncbi:Putative NADH-flavin reductase [Sphingomonas guangdongensis]|uniref:NADH-flavin reductase n=1 Tax=Sphingomonas guangdongensis TaxID=1141890 RepID=A0A285QEU9_9SPHN|nr:NAD(P)H-binding protein [Sphingomonas guangdongensis]SOB80048.1 Putative NADH-flavin reductase [Sphingomonas guangdongensis]
MKLAVFGASGPTGLQVVRQALAAGHDVCAVTRRPEAFPMHDPGLTVAAADVTDPRAVARATMGAEAVISTYGVPYGRKPISVYSDGARSIVAAMREHGGARLVCVSSTTLAGPLPVESWWWRTIVIPTLRQVVGRTLYDDMARMEAIVRASDLNWTIVRPGGLYDVDEPTGSVSVSNERLSGRYTARADLAHVLIAEASGTNSHPRQVVEAISATGPPSPLRTFWREAFGRR